MGEGRMGWRRILNVLATLVAASLGVGALFDVIRDDYARATFELLAAYIIITGWFTEDLG